jgi:hypothetical protein
MALLSEAFQMPLCSKEENTSAIDEEDPLTGSYVLDTKSNTYIRGKPKSENGSKCTNSTLKTYGIWNMS